MAKTKSRSKARPKAKAKLKAKAKPKAKAMKPRAAAKAKQASKPAPKKKTGGRLKPEALVLHGMHVSIPAAKVGLLLSLAGQPYTYRHVDLAQGEHKEPEYRAISRFGQVPALEHEGQNIVQSGVILEYLADVLGRFGGGDEEERRAIAEWLRWSEDVLSIGIAAPRALLRAGANADRGSIELLKMRGERALGVLDAVLRESDFVVGDEPTIADVSVFAALSLAPEAEFDLARYANITAWLARMRALPGSKNPLEVLPRESRIVVM